MTRIFRCNSLAFGVQAPGAKACVASHSRLSLFSLQYIELLRRSKLTTKLRAARSVMQERFPLTESLWLDWLQDEIAAGTDYSYMQSLFSKATKDYLSVAIWESYLR